MKSQIFFNVLPPQFLRCPLSFREVVTPLDIIRLRIPIRGAGTYLNILWTNQVYLKLGVDKIQK